MIKKIDYSLDRYERKFIVSDILENEFINFLIGNESEFKQLYEPRVVNSIYYDSQNFKLAFMNLNGDEKRSKIRLRFYGKKEEYTSPSLEIKRRFGNVGNKVTFSKIKFKEEFLTETLYSITNFNHIKDFSDLDPMILFPKILISYRRSYFLSACNKFRITYDQNISYESMELYTKKNKLDFPILSKNNIIEIKYNVKEDNNKSKILSNFPLVLSKNSKYTSGLQCLGMI